MSVSIWVVDDDRSIRWVLEKALGQEGYAVTCFEDADRSEEHTSELQSPR